tara:strand:- start:133 stop:291 length:159 start_codon:yes stop_codon:yes gene_type:complete
VYLAIAVPRNGSTNKAETKADDLNETFFIEMILIDASVLTQQHGQVLHLENL